MTETDLVLADGRTLHVYDTGGTGLPVFWHHGTPNTGEPPAPLLPDAARLGLRLISHDRPGYAGSTRQPGRDIASVAIDVVSIADALGVGHFAVMGHSGGGPHALACAALAPDRVQCVVSGSGLAPRGAEGLDWFAGMWPSGAAELRAAIEGGTALADRLAAGEFDPEVFTPADHAALAGPWAWLGEIAGQAFETGLDGMIDDDLAYVAPWGFDPGRVTAPVLILQGADDRMVPSSHGEWLAGHLPSAELRIVPGEGHVSVLGAFPAALDWLREHAARVQARRAAEARRANEARRAAQHTADGE